MSEERTYFHPGTTTSATTQYIPTPQPPHAKWSKIIFAVSTFGNEQRKTKEEMEDEQAWKAYQEMKTQFYQVSQMLADS